MADDEPRRATSHEQRILDSFDHHVPSVEQRIRIESNRFAYKHCAFVVLRNCPAGADTTAALRQLHESMMTANKAIACEPGTAHQTPPADIPIPPMLPESPPADNQGDPGVDSCSSCPPGIDTASPMDEDDRTP